MSVGRASYLTKAPQVELDLNPQMAESKTLS